MPRSPLCRLTVQGYSLYGPRAASHRARLLQFQPGLAEQGIDLQIHSLLDVGYSPQEGFGLGISKRHLLASFVRRLQDLRHAQPDDLAIVYAELLPLLPAWLEQRLLDLPYILDLDDAFYLKYRSGRLGFLSPFLGCKFDRLIAGASAVTAGNQYLAAYARRFHPSVSFLPSVVDTDRYRPKSHACSDRQATSGSLDAGIEPPFTVGWIGSPTTALYLRALVEPLQVLGRERPVRLLVVGGAAPTIAGVEVCELPWSLETEIAEIQRFDVGVMPLPDSDWTRGKCAYKLIQCLACGVPVVASPVGANCDVLPADCGVLAATSSDWIAAFRRLADDPQLRRRMGCAGRQWVKQHYSLAVTLPRLVSVIREVARQHPGSPGI